MKEVNVDIKKIVEKSTFIKAQSYNTSKACFQ